MIDEKKVPEYLGPEFMIGSIDILPESHKDANIANILASLLESELLNVYKSYP